MRSALVLRVPCVLLCYLGAALDSWWMCGTPATAQTLLNSPDELRGSHTGTPTHGAALTKVLFFFMLLRA
jgi:hypothetical protein